MTSEVFLAVVGFRFGYPSPDLRAVVKTADKNFAEELPCSGHGILHVEIFCESPVHNCEDSK
jgi:hypothetical protein